MAKFCFFTDPGKLKAQLPTEAFGPKSAAGGKDLFRVTHRQAIQGSGAPAIAVCDGIICAQTESSGALTLILKPSQTPPFEAPVVSYFIYKGIDPASLLSGDAVLDESAAAANDLTKRVAATWKDQNGGALTGSKSALGLDRDAAFLHAASDPSSKVFTDSDPIERLFTYPHPKFQLPVVKAGDRIGSFGTACGFEIVLLRLGYRPKLGFARSADNVIAVPSLPASNGGAPWQPDDYDFFVHWHTKEQALAYMDPAAYFGAFIQAKLYKSDGDDSEKVKGKDIYDEILATFANRNVAWLDIRNNQGYSYNLFGFYRDTIRFASRTNPSQSQDLQFRAGGWPLRKLQFPDVAGTTRRHLHRTALCLPVGSSVRPVVLVSKGFVTQVGPERPASKTPSIAPDSTAPGFFTPIRIAFPAAEEGGQDVLAASYTRINLYEKPREDATPASALDMSGGSWLDGVFRIRELRLDRNFLDASLRFTIYDEELLVDLEGRYGSTYAASVGIAEDADSVTLFAYPRQYLPNIYGPRERKPLPSWADTTGSGNFLAKLAKAFANTNIAKKTITPAGASQAVDTLVVRQDPAIEYNAAADAHGLDDYCLVVLPRADHDAMLAELAADTTLQGALPAFLATSAPTLGHDAGQQADYAEFPLHGIGFADSSGKVILQATPFTQRVYHDS